MNNKDSTSTRSLDHSIAMAIPKSASLDKNKPKFPLFPKLPIELRLKIWKESHEPRIIELRLPKNYRSNRYDFVIPKFPAALHVNKEARLESLKDYKMSFKHKQCRRPILFNFSIDTLHIRDHSPFSYPFWRQVSAVMRILPDKEKVQKLSVSHHFWTIIESTPHILLFPALKDVTVCSFIAHSWCSDLYYPEVHLKSHRGQCFRASDVSSCFPKDKELTLTTKKGSRPVSNIKKVFFSYDEEVVKQFLEGLHNGIWGDLMWQEPSFSHRALCLESLSEKSFYCRPYGVARRKRRVIAFSEEPEEREKPIQPLLVGNSTATQSTTKLKRNH
jgi:hypothetical protein